MSESTLLDTALCLPASDIEALVQGQMIAVIPGRFINPGRQFALYPLHGAINLQYYRPSFLPSVEATLTKLNFDNILIKVWARCEGCKIQTAESFDAISKLTVWTKQALHYELGQRTHIFLAYLRVYLLPNPIEISSQFQNRHFLPLRPSIHVSEATPVLTDSIFAQRKRHLENLEPPLHPELEELQSNLEKISSTNSAAQELNHDIKIFLNWSSQHSTQRLDSDLVWIKKIAAVGHSSDGNEFEKLVRRGLLKLGFTGSGLNPDAIGGAGGMDFYAEAPYPIVGECKATKSDKVSDGTPAQLLKIGLNHLGKNQYESAIKLIVAAGDLNHYALRTATENEMNVISPETLQKLVELQAKYKNSINLLELKECLQKAPFGIADDKVNNYIDKIEQNIKLRSHIIQVLKNYLELTNYKLAGVEALHAAYITSNPPQPSLDSKAMHEILIELSSPLTGYLGREKGDNWRSDRFYFLRDLPVN